MTDYAKTATDQGGKTARWLNVAKRTKGAASFTFYLAWDNGTKKATLHLRKVGDDPFGKKAMRDSKESKDRTKVGVPVKAKALRGFVDGDAEGSGVIFTVIEDLKVSGDAKGTVSRGQRIIKKLGTDYGDLGFLENNAEVRLLTLEEYRAQQLTDGEALEQIQKLAHKDKRAFAELGLNTKDVIALRNSSKTLTGLAESPKWIDPPDKVRSKRAARIESLLTKLAEDGLDETLVAVLTEEVTLLASRMPLGNDKDQVLQRLHDLQGVDDVELADDGGDEEEDDVVPVVGGGGAPAVEGPPAPLFDPEHPDAPVTPLGGALGLALLYWAGTPLGTQEQMLTATGFTNVHRQWGDAQADLTGILPDPNESYLADQLIILLGTNPAPAQPMPNQDAPHLAPVVAAAPVRPDWWDAKVAIVDEYRDWVNGGQLALSPVGTDRTGRTVGALGYTKDLTHAVPDALQTKLNQLLTFLEGKLNEDVDADWTRGAAPDDDDAADLAELLVPLMVIVEEAENCNLRLFGDLMNATTWHDWSENEVNTDGDYDQWFDINAVQVVIGTGGRFVFNLQGFTTARTTELRTYGSTIPRRLLNLQVAKEDVRSMGGVDIPTLTRTEYEIIAILWTDNLYNHTRWYTFDKMTDTTATEVTGAALNPWGLHATVTEVVYATWLTDNAAADPYTALRQKMLDESGAPDLDGILDDWDDLATPLANRFIGDDISPLWNDPELLSNRYAVRWGSPECSVDNKDAFVKYWIEWITQLTPDWTGEWVDILDSCYDDVEVAAPNDITAFEEIEKTLKSYNKPTRLP